MAKEKEPQKVSKSEIRDPNALRRWRRKPEVWAREVVGIGLCKCEPPCQMDPLHSKILSDYGKLIHAKKRVFEIDIKKRELEKSPHFAARERYDKIMGQIKEWQKVVTGPKNNNNRNLHENYERLVEEAKKLYPKLERYEKKWKIIAQAEKDYGWARKIVGISIQSAKGVGKTMLMALMIMHFYSLHEDSKGIVTAPKKDLLNDNLKAEIKKWIRHSQTIYGENSLLNKLIALDADKVYINVEDKKEQASTQFCAFRTANMSAPKDVQEQTLQGYHEKYMLLGCDEASGVADVVFQPLITTLTGMCNIMVLIFNPNRNTGFAIETQPREDGSHRKYSEMFLTYQISALDSTIITSDHIDNMRKFYTDDPNGWRVNVLGLPPLDDADALIPYSKIIEAAQRETPESLYMSLPRVGGFDVGAGGDPSAIAKVQGPKCHAPIHMFSSANDDEITNFGVETIANELIETVAVDGIGIGMFMPKILRGYGINAKKVDVRHRVSDDRFFNLRAQLYWYLREWILDGGDIPNDEVLIRELAILKIDRSSGKIQIISKQKLKKDGHKSTNKADALSLCMTFKNELVIKQVKEAARQRRCKYKEKYNRKSILSWLAK